ncbi:MAG: FAD-dependent oxidoreductase, partial [Pseudomonadota bacterium]
MTDRLFDIAIIGAGPTGAALALGLARLDLDVALIDARDPAAKARPDGRNFAIVTGSWRLLRSLGVTETLADSCQALNGLEAIDGGTHYFGQPSILFENTDLDSPDPDEPLGQMVMAEPLQAALDTAIKSSDQITCFAPARFEHVTCEPQAGVVVLDTGESIRTRLLVGADGMRSPVR